jgi:hypothetical protein
MRVVEFAFTFVAIKLRFSYFSGKPTEYDVYEQNTKEQQDAENKTAVHQPSQEAATPAPVTRTIVAVVPPDSGGQSDPKGGFDTLLGMAGVQGRKRLRASELTQPVIVDSPSVLRDLQGSDSGGDRDRSPMSQPIMLQSSPPVQEVQGGQQQRWSEASSSFRYDHHNERF